MTINYLLFNTQIIHKLCSIADSEYGQVGLGFEDNIIVLSDIDDNVILTLKLKEEDIDKSYELNTEYCDNKVELLDVVYEYVKLRRETEEND